MKNKERAFHVFARNPKLKELFITEDGQVFTDEQAANSQNTRFGKPEATKVNRSEFTEFEKQQEAAEKAAEKAAQNPNGKDVKSIEVTDVKEVKTTQKTKGNGKA